MTTGPLAKTGLSELASRYEALFCDIWGVVHNGVTPFAEAVTALSRFREKGGKVVLLTNASRPADLISEMLHGMGVSRSAFDHIISSGDVTRELVRAYEGRIIHFVGPHHDRPILDGLNIALGEPDEAAAVVVTGLEERTETPADYESRIKDWLGHRLPLICSNPDIVVEHGDLLEYCAGALAEIYAGLGGKVEMAGKPYPPIYDAAFRWLAEADEAKGADGSAPRRERILAIGDAVRTDALGASQFGLDFLFITGGALHTADFEAFEGSDDDKVKAAVAPSRVKLAGYMPRLVW